MAGLTLTLETSKQTLLNTQLQIQTASHNISNAQTTGYARQKAVLQTDPPIRSTYGWLGTGANVYTITQARDQFLEQRLSESVTDESQYKALASELENIQAAVADDGSTGISKALGDFYDAWDKLAQDPTDATAQTDVYKSAENLAKTIRTAYDRLNTIATNEIPARIEDAGTRANNLIDQIAEYNNAISNTETSQYKANDLRDARYQAMQELAQIMPVHYAEDASGHVTITTTDQNGSFTIVSGGTATHIDTATQQIQGGELAGLAEAQTDINGYMNRLNEFTSTLITQVNSLHGTNSGPAVFTGANATDIVASTTFLNGVTSSDESTRALALAGLQGTQIAFTGKTTTLAGYLSDIQQEIGTDAQQANTTYDYNTALRSQLQTQQQAISGVSLDEELVDLLQFQQVYQAAAKVIDKVAQLLNTVIQMG